MSGTTLEISIADDGCGFDFAAASAARVRNGLGNLQRRAGQMGGELRFTSRNGVGTTVTLRIQLPEGVG
jgi:signal transduction histidine kinase